MFCAGHQSCYDPPSAQVRVFTNLDLIPRLWFVGTRTSVSGGLGSLDQPSKGCVSKYASDYMDSETCQLNPWRVRSRSYRFQIRLWRHAYGLLEEGIEDGLGIETTVIGQCQ